MIKIERLSHIGILLIGISALTVSIWQVQMSMTHNKLSVKPFLRFSETTHSRATGELEAQYYIKNHGQGPAIIRSAVFNVNGKPYETILEAIKAAGQVANNFAWASLSEGQIIDEKAQIQLLNIDDLSKTKDIKIIVVYESIYGEVFEVNETF